MDHRNPHGTAWRLALIAVAMFVFGFAVAPLYGLICEVSGIQNVNGSRVSGVAPGDARERFITVRFDTTVQSDLPWEFVPEIRKQRVRVGAPIDVRYRVRNLTGSTITGQAVHNIVPWQATPYFSNTECFCFRQQTLKGGETAELPLRFVVSPDLPEGTDSLTVSYVFMRFADEETRRRVP